MICPSCLKNVSKLVGTDEVCPECFLAKAEDLIPAVLRDLVDDHGPWRPALPDHFGDAVPEGAGACIEDDGDWISEDHPFLDDFPDNEDVHPRDFPPRFRGVPRF